MESIAQIPIDVLFVLGLLLLVLFAVVFWAKRRGEKETAVTPDTSASTRSRPVRILIHLLKLAGFAVFSFLIIAMVLTGYLSYQTVDEDTAPAHHKVEAPPAFSLPFEEITFTGGDDLTMAGWYIPSQNGAVVILLHGYGGDRTAMTWHAEQLHDAGYGLLMYDERASGESEGEKRSYGWQDPADVRGAIRYLQNKADVNADQIGIAGCSIGGQIALQGAAYHPEIQAVWADGSAAVRAKDIPTSNHPIFWLVHPSNYLIDWLMAQKLEMDPPPAMIDIIGTIQPRPIMLVAGGIPHPFYGAEARSQERYATFAGENANVWVIDEAYHCDGPYHRPDEYAERLVSFFNEAFGFQE